MFSCEFCPRQFNSMRALEQHMSAKGHWPWDCETCDNGFHTKDDADDHMDEEDHWSTECNTCDRQFDFQHSMAQHMIDNDHGQDTMASDMVRLWRSSKIYQDIETIFDNKWYHDDKEGSIQSIYFNRRYSYLFDQVPKGWRRYFHGTQRACHVGRSGDYLNLCSKKACSLCGILRNGFKLPERDGSNMFGGGIYSTSVSSKANNYAWNHRIRSKLHGIILCLVYIGKFERLQQADNWKEAPAEGCSSVMGATLDQGGVLQYNEAVVYNRSAILPIGLIMYTRTPL